MKKLVWVVLAIAIIVVVTTAISGRIAPLSWGVWGDINADNGVGIQGYDVVSYHREGGPVPGSRDIRSEFMGVDWYFSSLQHKTDFDSDPEKFLPEFGGFCAYAVMKNFSADVNPLVWHIEEGRLYLFASSQPREAWVGAIAEGSISLSDQNWVAR